MNRKVFKATSLVALVCSIASASASAEGMAITRQIILSPAHKVAPYFITRASNGDLIIAGADSLGNYHAWATRVSSSGEPIWEYLDGTADSWTDYSKNGQQFYSATDLKNGGTLLCGIKRVENGTKLVAFLVRIGPDGKLIDRRVLQPAHDGMPIGGIKCIAGDNGVMVLSGLAVMPRGTGWLTRLDAEGNFVWEKFGDQYGYHDAMQADNGGLYIIRGNEVVKIDAEGNLLAQHDLPDSGQTFLHPPGLPTKVQIAAILPSQKSVIIDFDLNLKGPLRTTNIGSVSARRGLYSADGVATLFGSGYVGLLNQMTAGGARISKRGGSNRFILEPRFQSSWFYDAVPTDSSGREFATVRLCGRDDCAHPRSGAALWIAKSTATPYRLAMSEAKERTSAVRCLRLNSKGSATSCSRAQLMSSFAAEVRPQAIEGPNGNPLRGPGVEAQAGTLDARPTRTAIRITATLAYCQLRADSRK